MDPNGAGDLSGHCHQRRGYSHTSIAIADALRLAGLPTVEVHLTNVYRCEQYRHHSHIAEVATGTLCGLGQWAMSLPLKPWPT